MLMCKSIFDFNFDFKNNPIYVPPSGKKDNENKKEHNYYSGKEHAELC